MNDAICKVTSQSELNWRTRRHPTSQGDRYPIGEVEAGFRIEALMAGSEMGKGASEVMRSNVVQRPGSPVIHLSTTVASR